MPGGDRTGPGGFGPRTGRGVGYCEGFDAPGYANPDPGGGGLRHGRGWRRWNRTAYRHGFGLRRWGGSRYHHPGTRMGSLREYAKYLQGELEQIQEEIRATEQEQQRENDTE